MRSNAVIAVAGTVYGALLFVFLLVTSRGKNKLGVALSIAVLALLLYVPGGYYTELLLYRRRQRKKAQGK